MVDVNLARRIVALLNEMLSLDPNATLELMRLHVSCNESLAGHPTIQVGATDAHSFTYEVGLLGVLNGLVGVNSAQLGVISAELEGEDWASVTKIISFVVLDDRIDKEDARS